MILELATQTTDPSNVVWMVSMGLLGLLSGSIWQWRRNNRRNNPGVNADDYRYTGKSGSDWKAGRGETCKKHGERISAAEATVKALGAQQAAIHQSQTETRREIGELRRETSASFRGLHARLDAALSRRVDE